MCVHHRYSEPAVGQRPGVDTDAKLQRCPTAMFGVPFGQTPLQCCREGSHQPGQHFLLQARHVTVARVLSELACFPGSRESDVVERHGQQVLDLGVEFLHHLAGVSAEVPGVDCQDGAAGWKSVPWHGLGLLVSHGLRCSCVHHGAPGRCRPSRIGRFWCDACYVGRLLPGFPLRAAMVSSAATSLTVTRLRPSPSTPCSCILLRMATADERLIAAMPANSSRGIPSSMTMPSLRCWPT